MQERLKPIRTESLKDVFITRFENLILSGTFPVGHKLKLKAERPKEKGSDDVISINRHEAFCKTLLEKGASAGPQWQRI